MGQFQMKIVPTWGDLKVEYRRALIGELISEALAVAIIILIGDGAAAMITLYDPSPTLRPIGAFASPGGWA